MTQDKIEKKYDAKSLEALISDCRSHNNYTNWKRFRSFITQAIHKNGTFLDIGCANGFLLECLMGWSSFEIVPYGIDNRVEAIEKAHLLFPNMKDHFEAISGDELEKLKNTAFPEKFDFVYRNYWGLEINNPVRIKEIIDQLLTYLKPQGRAILGIYCGNANAIGSIEHQQERERLIAWTKLFKEVYPKFSGEAFSDSGSNHWIMWIDQS